MPTVRDQEQPGNVNGSGFGSALRVLAALSVTAVAAALVFMAWGSTETATSEVHGKIFLVGWAVAAVVIAAGFLITDLASRPRGLAAHAVSSLTLAACLKGCALGRIQPSHLIQDSRRAGNHAPVDAFLDVSAAEAEVRHGALRVPLGD